MYKISCTLCQYCLVAMYELTLPHTPADSGYPASVQTLMPLPSNVYRCCPLPNSCNSNKLHSVQRVNASLDKYTGASYCYMTHCDTLCAMLAALTDLSRVTSQASGLADISVMCSLGSEFGSTSSLAQEWRKLVDLCSDLQETDYDQTAASRSVIWRECLIVSCNIILYLLPC